MTGKDTGSTASPCVDADSVTDTESSVCEHKSRGRNGGKEAWSTLFGSFLIYYSVSGLLNSFGFFQDYYQRDYLSTAPPSTIAFIGTLQFALMNFLSTVAGGLCDSHGIKVHNHSYFWGSQLTMK